MKEESPDQFLDTQKLFDYGFDSFQLINIKDNESRYTLDSSTFFKTDLDIMGSSGQALELNSEGTIIIPKSSDFNDAEVELSYSDGSKDYVATLDYYFSGNYVGYTTLDYAQSRDDVFEFANILSKATDQTEPKILEKNRRTVFVNIRRVIIVLVSLLAFILLVIFIKSFISSYSYSGFHNKMLKKKRYKKRKRNINL